MPKSTTKAPSDRLKPKSKRIRELEARLACDSLFDDEGKTSYSDTLMDMRQVHETHGSKGLTVISSFSGGGGSTTGFAMSGWKEIAASEFVNAARETFAANYPTHIITPQDVCEIVKQWAAKYPDGAQALNLVFNKPKTVRGVLLPESFSWEKTRDNAISSGNTTLFDTMRLWVSQRAFKQVPDSSDRIIMWGDDIRGLDPAPLMEYLNIVPGQLDCFNGSPPCKSFSMSGMRAEKWGAIGRYSDERQQRSDDLFYEFARMVEVIKPKTFLVENVQGAAYGKAKDHALNPFISHMKELGYTVDVAVFNAEHYGVPQERKRLFVQGVLSTLTDTEGKPLQPAWPTPNALTTYTAREALEDLPKQTAKDVAPFWFGSLNEFTHHYPGADTSLIAATRHNDLSDPDEPRFSIGKMWRKLSWGRVPKDSCFQLVRVHPDKAAPTLMAQGAAAIGAAGASHWDEPRKFTIAELKALASFPADYVLTGHVEQQGERIGRSVPPLMMKAIADAIANMLINARNTSRQENAR